MLCRSGELVPQSVLLVQVCTPSVNTDACVLVKCSLAFQCLPSLVLWIVLGFTSLMAFMKGLSLQSSDLLYQLQRLPILYYA